MGVVTSGEQRAATTSRLPGFSQDSSHHALQEGTSAAEAHRGLATRGVRETPITRAVKTHLGKALKALGTVTETTGLQETSRIRQARPSAVSNLSESQAGGTPRAQGRLRPCQETPGWAADRCGQLVSLGGYSTHRSSQHRMGIERGTASCTVLTLLQQDGAGLRRALPLGHQVLVELLEANGLENAVLIILAGAEGHRQEVSASPLQRAAEARAPSLCGRSAGFGVTQPSLMGERKWRWPHQPLHNPRTGSGSILPPNLDATAWGALTSSQPPSAGCSTCGSLAAPPGAPPQAWRPPAGPDACPELAGVREHPPVASHAC